MRLDVPTLLLQTLVFEVSLALLMLLYVRSRKVYPGFGHWAGSTCAFALCYLGFLARPAVPLLWSVALVNGAVTLGGLLRMDGLLRFTGRGRLERGLYACTFLVAAAFVGMVLVGCSEGMRFVAFTLLNGVFFVTAMVVMLGAPRPRSGLHFVAVAIWGVQLAAMLLRMAGYWFPPPSDRLGSMTNGLFFAVTLLLEGGITSVFLLMNSQRLEQELANSRRDLAMTLQELNETLAGLKILRGMVTICSRCRKVRPASGAWQAIEAYVIRHLEVEFTHGVCEDCLHLHYGQYRDPSLETCDLKTVSSQVGRQAMLAD